MIGAHIPLEFHFPPAHRKNAFKAVREIIEGGVITREKAAAGKETYSCSRGISTPCPRKNIRLIYMMRECEILSPLIRTITT